MRVCVCMDVGGGGVERERERERERIINFIHFGPQANTPYLVELVLVSL